MAESKHNRTPETVLKLPDLEQSKSAVGKSKPKMEIDLASDLNLMPFSFE